MKKKVRSFGKLMLGVFVLHLITDWKENIQAFKVGYNHKAFTIMKYK